MPDSTNRPLQIITLSSLVVILMFSAFLYYYKKQDKEDYERLRMMGWSFKCQPMTDDKRDLLATVREEWVTFNLYWGSEIKEGQSLNELGYTWDIDGLVSFWSDTMPEYSWVNNQRNKKWIKHYEIRNEFYPVDLTYYHGDGVLFAHKGDAHAWVIEESIHGLDGRMMISPMIFYKFQLRHKFNKHVNTDKLTLIELMNFLESYSLKTMNANRGRLEESAAKFPADQSLLRVDNIERKSKVLSQAWSNMKESIASNKQFLDNMEYDIPPIEKGMTISGVLVNISSQVGMKSYITPAGYILYPAETSPLDARWIEVTEEFSRKKRRPKNPR